MNNIAAIVMMGALFVLAIASWAPFFGITVFNETQYLSNELGRTGIIFLVITLIGGLVYWAGRLK